MDLDTLIFNGIAITVNPDFEIIDPAVIGVRDGRIAFVRAQPEPLPEANERVNANGGIVIPGLINSHTHLPMTLFRGLADDLPLDRWLNEHIFPAESRHIHKESVISGTLLACAEMLLSGTTTCCDGYFLEDHVAEAVEMAGIRAVLGQGVIDFPAPGVPDPLKNMETALEFIQKWSDRTGRITPSIFCHSPYTCSEKTLVAAKTATDSKGLLFQIHAAETRGERDCMLKETGRTPIRYLNDIGVLNEKTLIVHGVWLTDADMDIIASRNSPVSHNPQSNMKLASGIAPVISMLQKAIPVALGTDGSASNNTLDLFKEMSVAAKLHKAQTLDPTATDARTVFRMATIEGAKALGLDRSVGSLEPGKLADVVIVGTDSPHFMPMYDPVSHLIYVAQGSDVRDVMIGGKWVVRNRKVVTLDMERIAWDIRNIAGSIKPRGIRQTP